MKQFIRHNYKYFIVFLLLIVPLFGHLGKIPIQLWDESRLAMNAVDVYENGNWFVISFKGNADMWNTKPPLMVWLQSLSFVLFGVNEFSVRFPSAMAALFTMIFIFLFAHYYLKNHFYGVITMLILATSYGYISIHGTRTGDYDSLLTLFTTLSALSFFIFFEKNENRWLYLFFLFTALSVLTKGIAGLFFLPALFLYTLYQKKLLPILKNRHFYLGFVLFLLLSLSYYFIREIVNPGYLQAVLTNELGGRYLSVIEGHEHPFGYYFFNFVNERFVPWIYILPVGIVCSFLLKDEKIKRITLFSLLMVVFYFFIISFAKTTLFWYDIPMYPFLALIVAPTFVYIRQLFFKIKWKNQIIMKEILTWIIIITIFFFPYKEIIKSTQTPQEWRYQKGVNQFPYFLQQAYRGKHNINQQFIIYETYAANVDFYLYILKKKNIDIKRISKENICKNQTVTVVKKNVKEYIETHFDYEIVFQDIDLCSYHILKKKNDNHVE